MSLPTAIEQPPDHANIPQPAAASAAGGKLSTADYALLGLLAQLGGQAHGYELARHFQRHELLGDVIHLEPAMLYKCLKKLARHDLVGLTEEPNEGRPPRQVSSLTPTGRVLLDAWLTAPVAHTRDVRLTFLVKLYFARVLAPAREPELIRRQHAVITALAGSLQRQLAEHFPTTAATDAPDHALRRQVISLRLVQTEAVAAWLAALAPPVAAALGTAGAGAGPGTGVHAGDQQPPAPGTVMAGRGCPAIAREPAAPRPLGDRGASRSGR